jgi:hypothetical protein
VAEASENPWKHAISTSLPEYLSSAHPSRAPRETSMAAIELAGFKQTYWSGHHHPPYAEPALAFPTTQSPTAAIKLLGGSTTRKLILCMVPKRAPGHGINRRNEFAGKMYGVVEVWAVVRATKEILDGYPASREVLDFWID